VIKFATRKDGLFDGIEDPILKERYGKKALWIDKDLFIKLNAFAKTKNKCPQNIAEYLLNLGVTTATNTNGPSNLYFDIEKL
jgi:hypothetical protein